MYWGSSQARLVVDRAGFRMERPMKKPGLSPDEREARDARRRVAAGDAKTALAEVERDASQVRKNMLRLRALRLAREAEIAAEASAATPPAPKKPKKRAQFNANSSV